MTPRKTPMRPEPPNRIIKKMKKAEKKGTRIQKSFEHFKSVVNLRRITSRVETGRRLHRKGPSSGRVVRSHSRTERKSLGKKNEERQ